jgi:hypothetical protein
MCNFYYLLKQKVLRKLYQGTVKLYQGTVKAHFYYLRWKKCHHTQGKPSLFRFRQSDVVVTSYA